jgi:hypothetical protein
MGLAGIATTTPARSVCFQARQACLYYEALDDARVRTGIVQRAAISLVLAGADARKTMRRATPPSSWERPSSQPRRLSLPE